VRQVSIRHDEAGDRTVTREPYAAEIAKTRKERPNIRFVVYDHSFEGDRAWFRFTLKWTDSKTVETHTRAGMQVYLWLRLARSRRLGLMFSQSGSAWIDGVGQEHWTSLPPISPPRNAKNP
jgi:hypothetical protein